MEALPLGLAIAAQTTVPASRTTHVLRRVPALRLLLASLAVSQIGNWLYNLSLLTAVYDRSHSGALLTVTTAARVLPVVVAGPLGGVLTDTFDRRRLMVMADVARAALMLVLAFVVAADLPVALIPALAALSSLAGLPYETCVAAVVPKFVSDDDLPAANSARSVITESSVIIGPLIGALLTVVGSSATAFVVNAATFVASGLLVLAIPKGDAFVPARTAVKDSVLADLRAGVSALREHPQTWFLAGADVLGSAVYGLLTVALLLLSRDVMGNDSGYGFLLAALGAGGLAGAAVSTRAMRRRSAVTLVTCGLIGTAVPLLLLGASAAASWFWLAVACVAALGAAGVIVEIQSDTALQRQIPEDVFGRAYGFVFPACMGAIVLGAAVAPVLSSLVGLSGTFVVSGLLVVVYTVLLARRSDGGPSALPLTSPRPTEQS